jgi:O-antigen/teichoic acid export membrane protein
MTGTTIAQAIPILISPILTRIYSPDDFGELQIFMSIVAIFGVIATFRYELAIMLPKEEKDAKSLLTLSLFISLVISAVVGLFVVLFKNDMAEMLSNKKVAPLLYFIPLTVFFMGVTQAFNYWSTREKTFRRNAASRISQSMGIAGTNLGLGFSKTGSLGLIIGNVAGQFLAALVLAWKTIFNFKSFRKDISKKLIKENAKKYKNFALINTPHALMDSLQDNGIVFILLYYFTSSLLGLYSFAFRILKAPVGLISGAIYQVFFERASKAQYENTNLQAMVIRMYGNLFLIGFPAFLILFIFAPPLFGFIFGEKWYISGEIAQILTPWLFLNFLASPVSSLAIIMNKQKEAMLITVVDISLRVAALVIGGLFGDYRLGFILLSAGCSSVMIFALFWYYKIAGIKTSDAYER